MPLSARQLALRALHEWRKSEQFADAVLHDLLASCDLVPSDRAFATELLLGVLRNLRLLDFWIAHLRRPRVDHATCDLLRLGLYQLLILQIPEHAAVNETVALSTKRTRSIVNAILREAQRQRANLVAAANAAPVSIRTSHPDFLVTRWTAHFGSENTEQLCAWNNQPPPTYARVNQLQISVADFRDRYGTGEQFADARNVFRFAKVPRDALAAGHCYMQDPSTMLACELLAPQQGDHVLDACAAPGGKSSYLAELMQNTGRVVAVDRNAARVALIRENFARLGVTNADVIEHDWLAAQTGAPKSVATPFDRILLDTPCSNTGVMRRRVDVRWRLKPDDFLRMQDQQVAIARAVLSLLKPGGTFVYSTCSVEPEENEQVVAQILAALPRLRLVEQVRRLPFRDHIDGAFAAKLSAVA